MNSLRGPAVPCCDTLDSGLSGTVPGTRDPEGPPFAQPPSPASILANHRLLPIRPLLPLRLLLAFKFLTVLAPLPQKCPPKRWPGVCRRPLQVADLLFSCIALLPGVSTDDTVFVSHSAISCPKSPDDPSYFNLTFLRSLLLSLRVVFLILIFFF